MTPKKHKLDIFRVLGQISKKNQEFFPSLTEEEQKGLQPLIVQRWLSGTQSIRQIMFLNEITNPMVFPLAKHPQLLVNLLSVCTEGRSQRYYWNKAVSKKTSKTPTLVNVIREFFGYNTMDAIDALPVLSDNDIMDYAEQLGYQSDDIKKIKKELKSRNK